MSDDLSALKALAEAAEAALGVGVSSRAYLRFMATVEPEHVVALLARVEEAEGAKADAWDEGEIAGAAAMYHDDPAPPNPYRTEGSKADDE